MKVEPSNKHLSEFLSEVMDSGTIIILNAFQATMQKPFHRLLYTVLAFEEHVKKCNGSKQNH